MANYIHFCIYDINQTNNIETLNINDLNELDVTGNQFFVFAMNISSIKCHFDELLVVSSTSMINFDIIVLYETWLLDDINFIIDGYQSINSLGVNNKSDGVNIFIKKRYQVKTFFSNFVFQQNSVNYTEINNF